MPVRERKAPTRRVREVPATRKFFLVGIFLVAQAVFFSSPMFRLQTVFVTGNTRVTDQEILTHASLPTESHLFSLDLRAVEARVGQIHWVKTAAVRRQLPGTATIRVEERVPVLAVARRGSASAVFPGSYFLVSADGWILSRAAPHRDAGLKRALIDSPLQVGRQVPPEVVESILASLEGLPSHLADAVTDVVADAHGQVTLTMSLMEQSIEVRVGGPDKTHYKFQVLEALLGKLKTEGGPVTYIDLRFSDPAVGRPAPAGKPTDPKSPAAGEEAQDQ